MLSLRSPYRRFHRKWWGWYLNPKTYFRHLRWFIQRGRRGWADCDTWNMDGYLCEVIPPMLERLKDTKGTPGSFFSGWDPSDQETDAARAAWHAKLDEMILGFKAAAEVLDGPPSKFYSPRPAAEIAAARAEADRRDAERADGCWTWISDHNFDVKGFDVWEKEQEQTRRKGFAAFTEFFYSLWD